MAARISRNEFPRESGGGGLQARAESFDALHLQEALDFLTPFPCLCQDVTDNLAPRKYKLGVLLKIGKEALRIGVVWGYHWRPRTVGRPLDASEGLVVWQNNGQRDFALCRIKVDVRAMAGHRETSRAWPREAGYVAGQGKLDSIDNPALPGAIWPLDSKAPALQADVEV